MSSNSCWNGRTEMATIRNVHSEDLDLLLEWRNHPDVRRYMLSQHEISRQEHVSWFQRASSDASRRLLLVEEEDVPLGFVNFSGVAQGTAADWGFYAAPGAPKGAGAKIGTAALDLAFDALDLHKVCGQALAFNKASIRFHEKLGFTKEGLLREQHRIDGVYHDMICFGLIRSEWIHRRIAR